MNRWSIFKTAALAGAVVIAVQTALLSTGNGAVLKGVLLDPDCYMHLQRALRILTEGGWHDTIDPRINAPFGYTIHWTALFDLLLVAGAAPLKALGLDAHSALYVWGSVISPLLLIAALTVFAWGVRTRVAGAVFLWLTVLIFTQPQFSGSFITGRPDHHSLVLGLMLAQLGWAYALFDGRAGPRWAIAAGVLAGLQLATSVEGLLTILLIATGIAAAWLVFGERKLKALTLYLGAAALTVVAWLLWERGRFLIEPAYDRVSIAHVVALASATLAMAAVTWAEARGRLADWRRKTVALVLAGLFAAATIGATYPDFFLGPWPHLDPVIVAWHNEIGELQPLLPVSWRRLADFLAQMTAPLLALPLILRRLRSDRPVMLLSLLGMVMFVPLGLAQMRWSGELQAVTLLPWTLTTVAIMESDFGLRFRGRHVPLRAFALAGALLVQMIPTLLTQSQAGLDQFTTHPRPICNWSGAIKGLAASVRGDRTVMAPVWYGPEILWHSDLRVIAGPYEMLPAMKDTAAFFHGSETAAREVVVRHGISNAIVCAYDNWPGFGGELAVGRHPDWLQPVPLPDAPKEFRLYKVVR